MIHEYWNVIEGDIIGRGESVNVVVVVISDGDDGLSSNATE